MGFTLKERGSDYFYELFYHLPKRQMNCFIIYLTSLGQMFALALIRASSQDLSQYCGRRCKVRCGNKL